MKVEATQTKRGPGRPRLPEYKKKRIRVGNLEDTMRAVVPQVLDDDRQVEKVIQLVITGVMKEI